MASAICSLWARGAGNSGRGGQGANRLSGGAMSTRGVEHAHNVSIPIAVRVIFHIDFSLEVPVFLPERRDLDLMFACNAQPLRLLALLFHVQPVYGRLHTSLCERVVDVPQPYASADKCQYANNQSESRNNQKPSFPLSIMR